MSWVHRQESAEDHEVTEFKSCHVLLFDWILFLSVSPSIAGSGPDGSAEEVTVTLSSPTSLVCEVQSYPPALITWLKDGRSFESSQNARVLPGYIYVIIF